MKMVMKMQVRDSNSSRTPSHSRIRDHDVAGTAAEPNGVAAMARVPEPRLSLPCLFGINHLGLR